MSRSGELGLLHVWLGVIVFTSIWSIRGRFDDLTFNARKKMGRLFLPGRLQNRERWIKQQRIMAYAALAFGLVIYALVMIKILAAEH
jgi:hypothetical protein